MEALSRSRHGRPRPHGCGKLSSHGNDFWRMQCTNTTIQMIFVPEVVAKGGKEEAKK